MPRVGNRSTAQAGIKPTSAPPEEDALTTRPTRRHGRVHQCQCTAARLFCRAYFASSFNNNAVLKCNGFLGGFLFCFGLFFFFWGGGRGSSVEGKNLKQKTLINIIILNRNHKQINDETRNK